jgi:hypothetical protein
MFIDCSVRKHTSLGSFSLALLALFQDREQFRRIRTSCGRLAAGGGADCGVPGGSNGSHSWTAVQEGGGQCNTILQTRFLGTEGRSERLGFEQLSFWVACLAAPWLGFQVAAHAWTAVKRGGGSHVTDDCANPTVRY